MGESTTGTQQNPARELFKYRVVNTYTLSFLRTGAVYFSSPQELNDPFDVRFVERDLRAEQQRFKDERLAEGTDGALLAVAMMNVFEREHRAGDVKTRVYCLSEIVDSVLMWSHYADSHRGICVVLEAEERGEPWWIPFASSSINLTGTGEVRKVVGGRLEKSETEVSDSSLMMLPAQKVLYRDEAPGLFVFDPLPGGPMRGVTFELVKHTAWAYERERRVVVREALLAENPAHLASDVIVGLVFGMKTSKADVVRVREAIDDRERARPITYSRMLSHTDGITLERVPIADIDEFIRTLE